MQVDKEKLLRANSAFYAAFAAADFESMAVVWSQSEAVSVIHPGRNALHGRHAVMESWQQILDGAAGNEIQCANARAYMHGDSGYVLCHEIFPQGRLIATNVFVLEADDWRMVHHQAGPDTLQASTEPYVNSTAIH